MLGCLLQLSLKCLIACIEKIAPLNIFVTRSFYIWYTVGFFWQMEKTYACGQFALFAIFLESSLVVSISLYGTYDALVLGNLLHLATYLHEVKLFS